MQKMRPWCKRMSRKRLAMQKTSLDGRQGACAAEGVAVLGSQFRSSPRFLLVRPVVQSRTDETDF